MTESTLCGQVTTITMPLAKNKLLCMSLILSSALADLETVSGVVREASKLC